MLELLLQLLLSFFERANANASGFERDGLFHYSIRISSFFHSFWIGAQKKEAQREAAALQSRDVLVLLTEEDEEEVIEHTNHCVLTSSRHDVSTDNNEGSGREWWGSGDSCGDDDDGAWDDSDDSAFWLVTAGEWMVALIVATSGAGNDVGIAGEYDLERRRDGPATGDSSTSSSSSSSPPLPPLSSL